MALARPNFDATEVIDRMKSALGVKTDTELSNIIGVSNKTVSSWRSRNSIPMEIVTSVGFATETKTEYLISGIDVKYQLEELNDIDQTIASLIAEKLLINILTHYAEEKLAFMDDEEKRVEGIRFGAYISIMYAQMTKAKRMLVDEGGLSLEKFIEFERKQDAVGSEAIKLRDRLKAQK